MPGSPARVTMQIPLDLLRTELADLAYDLERQGRRDAADVVMMFDARVREMAEADGAQEFHHDNHHRHQVPRGCFA